MNHSFNKKDTAEVFAWIFVAMILIVGTSMADQIISILF